MNGNGGFVIESERYEQTRQDLIRDPIIQFMAEGLAFALYIEDRDAIKLLENPYEFVKRSLDGYNEMGGRIHTHIGGPAEVILRLLEYYEKGE